MNRRFLAATAALASLALMVSGCGADGEDPAEPETPADATATEAPADEGTDEGIDEGTDEADGEPQGEITLAGWSLSTTPEFQTLADGFNATNPDYTVTVAEYQAGDDYDTQMITDLAAGTAPDVYVIKNLKNFYTYADGDQLLDVSDIAGTLDNESVSFYEYDGGTYAIPYRQDAWFLYYNMDLFDAAGVEHPDGSWTWDDYAAVAAELSENLEGDVRGTYHHAWQSVVQGFANSQSGADVLTGEFDHFKPYYQRALEMQDAGAMENYGTVTTNSLSYQAQFGTQKAAMLPMGSWYIATLVAQQASGEAEDFAWGIAPAPQQDSSTAGIENSPVTFGDPTGMGINPAIDDAKLETAEAFLAYVASEEGSTALADIGITPSVMSADVTESFFQLEGIATDELSQATFENRTVFPENPVGEHTAAIQNLLNEVHSAVLSGSEPVDDAFDRAQERAQNEIINR